MTADQTKETNADTTQSPIPFAIRIFYWIIIAVIVLHTFLLGSVARSWGFGFSWQSVAGSVIACTLFNLPAILLYYFLIPPGRRSAKRFLLPIAAVLFLQIAPAEIFFAVEERAFKAEVAKNPGQPFARDRWILKNAHIGYTGSEYYAND